MWRRTIDCLGVAVRVSSTVTSIDTQLTAVFRTYAESARAPAMSYVLESTDWPRLIRDGNCVARLDDAIDLVAALELDLYAAVVRLADGIVLHAGAVVGSDGRALVLAGHSGSGKSTLVRAMLDRGYRYLSEECVALEQGACRGLARALHADSSALQPAGFECDEYVIRTPYGLRTMALFHPPDSRVWRDSAAVAAVVALSHDEEASDTLVPLSSGEAVVRLWPTVFHASAPNDLDSFAALAALPCYWLHTTSAARAQELVCALATELRVVP